jgi:N-acetylmuramoyl-L-alanine amidase
MAFTGRFAALAVVMSLLFIAYTSFTTQETPVRSANVGQVLVSSEENAPIVVDAEDFLVEVDPEEFECMRLNMYYEARNQRTDDAFIAVGYTVLNRVEDPQYPDTVCDVVQQARRDASGLPIRNKCQFSWYCDGKDDVPNLTIKLRNGKVVPNTIEQAAWDRATELAMQVMRREVDNPVGDAVMYHATYVSPYWKKAYARVAQIETHIFYSKA